MDVVAADIGGTNARFAIAGVERGKVIRLGEFAVFPTARHDGLKSAWEAYGAALGRPLPAAAAIAIAAPVFGDDIRMTNGPWRLRRSDIAAMLGVDSHIVINDFAAVAHAVAHIEPERFRHLAGPDVPLPASGVISIVGPGTGLGVAALLRAPGCTHVIATEGAHTDFAPVDDIDDRILSFLRKRLRRVSVERVVSGPGLAAIYEALAGSAPAEDDTALWTSALGGADKLAAAALDRFCLNLGSVAGDIALVQGAGAVVIAGGIGQRIADTLARPGFADRFTAKGRYRGLMETLPVKLIAHPQPGLYGAAAAFAAEFAGL